MVSGGDRLAIVQAAVAATLSSDLGVPLVDPAPDGEIADRQFLELAGGVAGIGQPIGSELLGLERLMRKSQAAAAGEDTGEGSAMTDVDVNLDAATARLQDKILNPALPFQVVAPPISELRTINAVYGGAVTAARVAGEVGELPPPAQEAWDLLFDGETPTETLQRYRDYEQRVDALAGELESLGGSASPQARQRLQDKFARLEAEWIALGRKQQVDRAFDLIRSAQADAGFEDERAAVLQRFQSGRRPRSDLPSQAYFESHVVPVDALFTEPGADPRWRTVVLDREQVVARIDARARRAFGLDLEDVERGTDELAELRFEYLVADILRDWLDPDFLQARYWRLDEDAVPLSDGTGGGTLPCLPTRVVFVRAVEYAVAGYGVAGDDATPAAAPKRHRLLLTETPTVTDDAVLQAARAAGLTAAVRMLKKETEVRAAPTTLALPAAQFMAMPEKLPGAAAPAAGASSSDEPGAGTAVLSQAINQRFTMANVASLATAVTGTAAGPKVRDHRDDDGGRGRRRGRRKPAQKKVRVAGSVTIHEEDGVLPELVVSHAPIAPRAGAESAVTLTRVSPTEARFETELRSRLQGSRSAVAAHAVRLRLATGEILAQDTVDMDGDTHTHEVDWRVVPEPTGIVVAEEVPIVHGYIVRGVPACPDPDPKLVWE